MPLVIGTWNMTGILRLMRDDEPMKEFTPRSTTKPVPPKIQEAIDHLGKAYQLLVQDLNERSQKNDTFYVRLHATALMELQQMRGQISQIGSGSIGGLSGLV